MSFDMDNFLDAIRMVESGGNDRAISPKGAKGPYQFMDATAKQYGLNSETVFQSEPARNAARQFMGDLLNRYKGDTTKALAAWNWGSGNLESKGMDAIPVETSNFITKVMTNYGVKGPSASGLITPTPAAGADNIGTSLYPPASPSTQATQLSLYPNNAPQLAQTVDIARGIPADKAAKIYQLALRTGLPTALIERNLDSLSEATAKQDFNAEEFRQKSPLVAAWLAEDKNRAAIAKFDYDGLSTLESLWAGIKSIPSQFGRGIEEDRLMKLSFKIATGTATPADQAEQTALKSLLTSKYEAQSGIPSWLGAAAKIVGQNLSLSSEALQTGAAVGYAGGGIGAALGMLGGPGAPVSVPAGASAGAITGLTLGTQAAFVEGLYERSVGEAYDEIAGAVGPDGTRVDPTVARFAAMAVGVPNAALEMLSATKALKLIPGSDKLLSRLSVAQVKAVLTNPSMAAALADFSKKYAGATITETVTEGTQEFLQILARNISAGIPGFTENDARQIASASEQAFKGMAVLGIAGVGPTMIQTHMEIARAEHNQSIITGLGEAAQTQFAQASPSAFGDLTTKLAQDAAVRDVFIPIEQWDTVFGDKATTAAKEVFGAADQYYEAKTHNGDLVIPVGLYAEKLAGTQYHEMLAQDIRLSPDGLTLREAAIINSALPSLEKSIAQDAADNIAQDAKLNQIYDDVKTKLADSGMGEISAHRNAMLWRELFNARADMLGMDPVDLYKENPFTIHRELPSGAVLNQEAVLPGGQTVIPKPILKQGKQRGFFDPNNNIIGLLKDADPSTFLHESGHFWLEMMRNDALRENAPAQFKIDWETLKAWSGATDTEISVAAHEQFARGLEAYVMEGKAPSLTLREAFAQFSAWLVKIYKGMKALGVELTPEVRDVMDRMFATNSAIQEARKYSGYGRPIFPAELLTPEEAAAYQQLNEQAKFESEEALRTAVMKQLTRESLASWRQARESIVREIRAEMGQAKDWKLLTWLQRGKFSDGSVIEGLPHTRLDMAAVQAMGFDIKKLPVFSYQKEGGISPSVLAELFGFRDGREAVQAIMSLPKRTAFIEEETIQRMQERFGDLYSDPEAMADHAALDIQNAKQIELFSMELRLLKRLGARKEQTRPAILRDLALSIVSRKKIEELEPRTYEQAAIKAGNEAQDAIIARNYNEAFDAKQRQILNVFLYKIAAQTKQEIRATVEGWQKTLFKSDQRLSHTRDMNLLNAARAVVAAHGIGTAEGSAMSFLSQVREYDEATFENLRDIVELAISDARKWDKLSVTEFKTLTDAVQGLTELSRRSKVMEIEGKKIERSKIRGELGVQIGSIVSNPAPKLGYSKAVTKWEKTKLNLAGIVASLRRVEHWVDATDNGNINGPFRKYIWQPISDASIAFRHAKEETIKKYLKLLDPIAKTLTNEKIAAPELGYTFAGKAELLGAMLHTGNESNFQKLLRGRMDDNNVRWGDFTDTGELDSIRWDRFIDRAQRQGIITKADYDFLQSVWDLMEGLKPQAQKAHKEVHGFYFPEITNKPFDTHFGNYDGGYFPAIVDPYMSSDAQLRADQQAIKSTTPVSMFPSVARGFTKSRVEQYAAPLAMDLGLVPSHINAALLFSYLAAPIQDVARLVNDRQFQSMLAQLDPKVKSEMLVPWLQRSAAQIVEMPSTGTVGRTMSTFFRHVRANAGLAMMVGNVVNTLDQVTGVSQAAVKVKPKYLMGALWRLIRSPMEIAHIVTDKSSFMADRNTSQIMDVQYAINDILLNPSVYDNVKNFTHRHGYFMQVGAQNIVDLITWSGAYEQAMTQGLTEPKAIRSADSIVRETQGSFAPEDMSRFETGTAFARIFTMFSSYFNMSANLLGTEFVKAVRQGGFNGAARGIYVYMFGLMIPALVSRALHYAAQGGYSDDDDDGYTDNILNDFFFGQIQYGLSLIPVVGNIASAAIGGFDQQGYSRMSISPAISLLASSTQIPMDIYKLANPEGTVKGSKVIRDVLSLVSLTFGLPFLPLARPLGYASDVAEGLTQPTGPLDYTRGLITGKQGVQ